MIEPSVFQAREKVFPLTRTYVMGILNVTPDSFSDGGRYFDSDAAVRCATAVRRAMEMQSDGADILDIGGQSTRPGYTPISPEEEWARIERVIPAVVRETGLAVSVDTFYPQVAVRALEAGAHIINDVSGFGDAMMAAVADSGCGCVVMHPCGSRGSQSSRGSEICGEARAFFEERRLAAGRFGIAPSRLCFDPGVGFGKTYEENLRLIARVGETRLPGCAFLMAASRKRVIGEPCGNPPFEERLAGTLAAHTAAVLGGADMVRVHDVREAVQAARMADALRSVSSAL